MGQVNSHEKFQASRSSQLVMHGADPQCEFRAPKKFERASKSCQWIQEIRVRVAVAQARKTERKKRAHFNPIFLAAHSNRCYCANAKSQLIALNLIAGLQVEYDSVDNLLTWWTSSRQFLRSPINESILHCVLELICFNCSFSLYWVQVFKQSADVDC